jgi:hypothetical protein
VDIRAAERVQAIFLYPGNNQRFVGFRFAQPNQRELLRMSDRVDVEITDARAVGKDWRVIARVAHR